jgi:hypothetical protein
LDVRTFSPLQSTKLTILFANSFGDAHLRAVWRISLGLGFIPAMAVFLWRLRMEEPTRYRRDSMKHAKVPYLLILRRYWLRLAAISLTWFIYDFITYVQHRK